MEIFRGDHAFELELIIHHQNFFNTRFVHFFLHFCTRCTFFDCREALFWRHHSSHRFGEISNEANVTASDYTNQFIVFSDNRETRKTVVMGKFHNISNGLFWTDSDRVSHHTRFKDFHLVNLSRLLFNRHILVNKANAAFLSQSDRKTCFRNSIHRRRNHRDVQRNIFG
ncbi:Uncharacterised protein [Vibrio cholerae]|nr:Uncharacterised protein [Vibrio cholerae]CSC08193.1 Uncharacterised protein [Vibrio cholerae]CSC55681.1 Uncharacterised protein [Vibrio cholerae]